MSASCKRVALFILAFVASIVIPVDVLASPVQIGGLYYNLNAMDHTASVAPGAKASDLREKLIIPSRVEFDNEIYNVTSIEGAAFQDIRTFSYLDIPASVTSIGNNAFSGCTNLVEVKFEDSDEPLSALGLFFGESSQIKTLYLGRYIIPSENKFAYQFENSSLSRVVFSPCIKAIPKSLFYKCANLISITIPEGIVELEDYCFTYCTGLKELHLPSTIVKIGEYSFNFSDKIENVYSYASFPPVMDGENAFWDILHKTDKPTLHVLPYAVDAYSTVFPWKEFGKIIGDLQEESTESVLLSAEGNGTLTVGECSVHNASQSVEVSASGGEVEVKAVPDHGYEFKSLTAALADGSIVYYTFRHEGGDIIASVPFTNGMKLSASFVQPEVHNLTVSCGDGSKYNVKVATGKAYSFDYTAPHGYAVNSVTFADEPLQVSGLSTQTVNIQTPQLNSDGVLNIAIAAIVTDVQGLNANVPSVIVNDNTIVLYGLKHGETVTVSSLSGFTQTYSAIGDTLAIPVIEEGVYVIVTSCATLKVRI